MSGQKVYGRSLYLLLNFVLNIKPVYKIKSIKKQKKKRKLSLRPGWKAFVFSHFLFLCCYGIPDLHRIKESYYLFVFYLFFILSLLCYFEMYLCFSFRVVVGWISPFGLKPCPSIFSHWRESYSIAFCEYPFV